MAGLGSSWGSREEFLHPRDKRGRFRKKWKMADNVINSISSFLDRFSPRTFQSDGQAAQYLFNRAKPGRFGGGTQYSRLHGDYDEANEHLRAGDIDAPTQKFVKMMDDSAVNLDSEVILSRTMGPEAFGLTPQTLGLEDGGLEDFTGRLIADRGYSAANIGTPLSHGPGKITMSIAVPKGTKAIIPARSQNDRGIFLDRDQELRITKVEPDGRGGYYMLAVATPRTPGQTPEPIDRGPRGVGLTPQEREARVLRGQSMQAKREGIRSDAEINAEEVQRGTQQGLQDQPTELPPAQGPPPAPGEPPPRNEPVVTEALGGPDLQGKGTAEIAETPPPEAPAAPEVPAAPAPDIRRAVREAGVPSPSSGSRRREWNNAYLGVASGKKDPGDMLRELERDIDVNRHRLQDQRDRGDTTSDPTLEDDIKAQEQLADLISREYGVQRQQAPAPAAPAKRTAPSKVTPIAQAPGERRRELPGESGTREVTTIKKFQAKKAAGILEREERKRRLLAPEPETPPQRPAPKKAAPAKVIQFPGAKKAAPAAPAAPDAKKTVPGPPSIQELAKEVGLKGDASGIVPSRQLDLKQGMSTQEVANKIRRDADDFEKMEIDQGSTDPAVNAAARKEQADNVTKLRKLADRLEASGPKTPAKKKAVPVKRVGPDVVRGRTRATALEPGDRIMVETDSEGNILPEMVRGDGRPATVDKVNSDGSLDITEADGTKVTTKGQEDAPGAQMPYYRKETATEARRAAKKAAPVAPAAKKVAPVKGLTKDERARDAALEVIDRLVRDMADDEEANRSPLGGLASPLEAIQRTRSDIEAGRFHPRDLEAMFQTFVQNRKETPFGGALAAEALKLQQTLDELGFGQAGPNLKPLKLAKKAAPVAPAAKKLAPAAAPEAGAPDIDKMTVPELKALAQREDVSLRGLTRKQQIKDAIEARRTTVGQEGSPGAAAPTDRDAQIREAGLNVTNAELQIIANNEGVPRRGRPTRKADLQDAILARRTERAAPVEELQPPIVNNPVAQRPIQAPDRKEAFADDWLNTPAMANIGEDTAAGRSINEVRDDVLKGQLTPDEGIRRLEVDIEINKSDLAEVERELRRGADLDPEERDQLRNDREKLRAAIRDQENASSFMRKHFRKAPEVTPQEVEVQLDPETAKQIREATPEEIKAAGRLGGFNDLKGDTREELLQDLIKKVNGKELESRATKKAAPKKLAPAPLEPKKATAPGHVDARLIAEGLDMDESDSKMLQAIQEDLDDGKKTPAAVGRELADLANGPAGPGYRAAVISGHAERGDQGMTPERQREYDAAIAQRDRWLALADRLQKTRRPSARKTAPPAPSTKLTPEEKKTTKAAAELLDVPAETLQKQVVAKRAAAAPPPPGAQQSVDAMKAMQSREEGQAFLKNRTKAELTDIAKAGGISYGAKDTKAKIADAIVQWTIGRRLDSDAISRPAPSRGGEPQAPGRLEDMSPAELADLEAELGIKRTSLDRGDRIAAIRARQGEQKAQASLPRSLPASGRKWNWETIEQDNMTMHGDSASMELAQKLRKAGREDAAQYVADMRWRISNMQGEHSPDDVEKMVSDLKAMMQAEQDPSIKALYARALQDIEAPKSPAPKLPESTPPVLRKMMDELNQIPAARRTGHFAGTSKDVSAVDRLAQLIRKVEAGDGGSVGTVDSEIRSILRSFHESVDGAFQMWRLEPASNDPEIRAWVRSFYPKT